MPSKKERRHYILEFMEHNDGDVLSTRVLAERFGVSEMTVRRDFQELSEEGLLQRQHGGASSTLRSRDPHSRQIGILLVSRTGKYSDPFFNALLEGVDQRLDELGYHIAYINTRAEVNSSEQVRELLQSTAVNGIILVGPPLGVESISYLKANMRELVGTIDSIGLDYDTITFDGYNGMRQMVDHLVKIGHQRLGFITGHHDQRQRGFMDGVAAHRLPADPELCVCVPFGIEGWTPELGHIGVQQLMALPQPPDAIVCASDLIAIGAIQWLHQHGIRVPEDVAVTGFDNINESAFTAPSLTTIHVHKHLIGALAAERIVKRIENEQEIPLFIQTPTELVVRRSCGSDQLTPMTRPR